MNTLSLHTRTNIKQVLSHYLVSSKAVNSVEVTALGNGLINQTYLVSFGEESLEKKWVLQRINKSVFPIPEHIMENAEKINQHLIKQKSHKLYPFDVATQILTNQGKTFVKIDQEYWRVMDYISQSFSIEEITNNQQAQQVAQGFAYFASALADFPAHTLHTIIPNFLDINSRIEQLNTAIKVASKKRLDKTEALRKISIEYQDFIDEVNLVSKSLPLRAVHHDTKINNLLFSHVTQNVAAVVDLDTCMPGYLMYDFGDMVRSCCSTLTEGEHQLDKATLNMERFEILTKHYIRPLRHVMTPQEHKSLALGVILLPLILGVRFLTDYLNNDKYFKINYADHNLDRAKDQLALFQHLYSQKSCIYNILNNN